MTKLELVTCALACGLIAVLAPPAWGSEPPSRVDYALGTYVSGGGHDVGLVCTYPHGTVETAVGGACQLSAPRAERVTLGVADSFGAPVVFLWEGLAGPGETCGTSGTAFGTATVPRPASCLYYRVHPQAGSPSGTIRVEA